MAENDVFLSSYGLIRFGLPNGQTLEAKPLPLERAAYFLGYCVTALADEPDDLIERRLQVVKRYHAIHKIATEFPAEIGAADALSDLTPIEVVGVAMRFFMASPTRNGQSPQT